MIELFIVAFAFFVAIYVGTSVFMLIASPLVEWAVRFVKRT